jgi:hypothetical protein
VLRVWWLGFGVQGVGIGDHRPARRDPCRDAAVQVLDLYLGFGLGFGVWGLGLRVWSVDMGRVWGLGFKVQGLGFKVQGSGFRVQNLGVGIRSARCRPGRRASRV